MPKELTTVAIVKANRKTYFVQLKWRYKTDTNIPVYWLLRRTAYVPKKDVPVVGMRLDEYLVKLDGDAGWAATVTVAGEPILSALDDAEMIIGRTAPLLSITHVTVQLGAQKELALPLHNILTACIKVGMITGTLHAANDQNPNGYITTDISSTGHPMTPDERNDLMGNPRRLPAASIEQQQQALLAAIDYKTNLAANRVGIDTDTGTAMTVYKYVTEATGIKDGKTLLQNARKNPELQELAQQTYIRKAKK